MSVNAAEEGYLAINIPAPAEEHHAATFRQSREMTRQGTRPVAKQGNLFDVLRAAHQGEKAAKHAIMLHDQGNLYSTLTDGINGGPLVNKVIKAFSQIICEQSESQTNPIGLPKEAKERIGEQLAASLPISLDCGETDKNGQPRSTPFPLVVIESRDFASRCRGGELKGGKDVEEVMDVVTEMEHKEVFIQRPNGHYTSMKLLTILGRDINPDTGQTRLAVQLSPLFIRAISHDYVTFRSDTLLMQRGKQSDMTMRLHDHLAIAHSHRGKNSAQHNDLIYRIDKASLYEIIALSQKYARHPGRREEDFKKAVDLCKEWLLITDYKEKETQLGTQCVFTLNPDYRTAPTPEKYLPKKRSRKSK